MHRLRRFGWLVFLCASGSLARAQETLELKPLHKQLFLDDYVIKEVHNLRRTLHQPEKIGSTAVIRPEESWEDGIVGTRNAPFWDATAQLWKLYYHGAAMEKDAASGQSAMTYRQCLAVSKDGLVWTKPALGLVEWNGSKANNIVTSNRNFLYHVVYDAKGGNERYKGLFGAGGRIGMNDRKPAVSADGLHWKFLDVPVISSEDQSKLIYDEIAGQYLLTVKHEGPYGRSVYLTTSKDFHRWSDQRLIFYADGTDQEATRRRIAARLTDARFAPLTINQPADYNVDVYNMPVAPYEGIYIGMPMFFNQSGPTPIGNAEGFYHVELVTSRDLLQWHRVASRAPFMETSHVGTGAYDIVTIVPPDRPVVRDGELWFYSSGNKFRFLPSAVVTEPDGSKTFGFPKNTGAIYLSRLRLDGFVSMDAGELEGALLTRPFLLRGKRLAVNVRVREGGSFRAEILDATGRKVADGFSLEGGVPVTGDQLRAPLAWQSGKDLGSLDGQQVRLRFVFRRASLYSFWVAD